MHLRETAVSAVAIVAVGWIFLAPVPEARSDAYSPFVRVTLVGDMMFDRTIRSVASREGGEYLFSCIKDRLAEADFVVGNLEGPITSDFSKSQYSAPGDENNMIFTFPLSTAALLLAHNVTLVNLGNNHIGNFGSDGIQSTIRELGKVGVSHFGDPLSSRTAMGEVGNTRFAFINYNEFGGSRSATLKQIVESKDKKYIPVVYAHWGEEYLLETSERLRNLAHEFVDAGAELVVGSHPHVIGEHEVYKEKHIYYSLGNFIFDQYWNESVRRGLLLDVWFDASGVSSIKETLVELRRDGRTCPL